MKERAFVLLFLVFGQAANAGVALPDSRVKVMIIQQSIADYPGTCPCPYSVARNGTRCGRRSAYSRPGGYAPI